MRFTSRLRDRLALLLAGALVAGSSAIAVVSCGSNDGGPGDVDGATSVDAPVAMLPPDDAAAPDTSTHADAATSDAGPRPVVCGDAGFCATALVVAAANDDKSFCALGHDGTVACWGSNAGGQLGRGVDSSTLFDSPSPERIAGLTNIVSLGHACAVDASGAVWCWGSGPFLQNGQAITTALRPVRLPIPSATLVDTRFLLGIAGSGCAITGEGPVCWGTNDVGEVAPPSIPDDELALHDAGVVAVPTGASIVALAIGNAAFVTRSDGTVLSWGSSPPLARVTSLYHDPVPRPIVLEHVTSVDAVGSNACATADGLAYCWGSAAPPADTRSRLMPAYVPTPEPVVRIATTDGENFDVAALLQRACAIGISGDVFCWGNNEHGQAGDGTQSYAFSAVRVKGLPGPAADVKTSVGTSCAILTDGRVYCWGDNEFGELGSGTLGGASLVPQEIVSP